MMNFIHKRKQQRGIGLLELMLSLAIIAILLVMATRYFLVASMNEKINTTISTIGGMQGAVTCWRNSRGDLADATLKNMDSIGCLPAQLWVENTETVVNPWGTAMAWTPSATGITIDFTNVPGKACKNLKMKYGNDADFVGTACDNDAGGSFSYTIK